MSQGWLISEKVSAGTQDTNQPKALGSYPSRELFLKSVEPIV
jgi:hypothetical protein